jgi:hypothetical protein
MTSPRQKRAVRTDSPQPAVVRAPTSFAQVLASFPDMKSVARFLNAPYWTVTAWKARDAIPVNYWKGLVVLAQACGVPGVTHDLLVALGEAKARERLETKQNRRSEPLPLKKAVNGRSRSQPSRPTPTPTARTPPVTSSARRPT